MLDSVLAPIAAWIVAAISAAGYAGVAGLMALESACIPLPSEVIMPFAGYLASTGRFSVWMVATAGAVGCNIGSTLAYTLLAPFRHCHRRITGTRTGLVGVATSSISPAYALTA